MAIKKVNLCKWVAALESGKFRKTTGYLKAKGAYCVLGVACKVYEDETGKKVEYGEYSNLPAAVRIWYGLEYSDPTLIVIKKNGEEIHCDATSLNDDFKISFKQFAASIVKQFKLACK